MNQETLQHLLKDVVEELKSIGIPVSDNICGIQVNSRAKKRLGCCKALKKTCLKTEYVIEISEKIVDCEKKFIKGVIAHELLHTCKGCMNHGELWKKYAELVNSHYEYNIKRLADFTQPFESEEKNKQKFYRYELRCRGCGAVIKRERKSRLVKNPGKFRCAKCGSSLDVYNIHTTSSR